MVQFRAYSLLLLASLVLAGCAQQGDLSGAAAVDPGLPKPAAAPATSCPSGAYLAAVASDGAPRCSAPFGAFRCPEGEYVDGFGTDGVPHCSRPSSYTSGERAKTAPPVEPSASLRVVGVYGYRNDTSSQLHKLVVNLELPAGASPLEMRQLLVRYTDDQGAYVYAGTRGVPHGFDVEWIRGSGSDGWMRAGDLASLELVTWPTGRELAPRTSVGLAIIPEAGSPAYADFKTPATYGTDKIITLR